MNIKRGGIYIANLDPQHGTEPGKTRPVVVLQTDLLNETGHPSTIICPITTKVEKRSALLRVHLSPGEGGTNKESDILIDQIRSIDNRRFQKLIGHLSSRNLAHAIFNLRKILDM